MKKLKLLKLQGEIPTLTKTEEGYFKGGFGTIGTGGLAGVLGNRNCGQKNGSKCDNTNCTPCTCNEYM